MTAKETFLSFADINKQFEKAPLAEGEKKPPQMVRKGYFNKESHNDQVSWKSVKLLTFYITRFGEIKPRRFMGNSVSQQKKVRQAILRAREL
jgi:ribosomal protein S18